MTEPPSLFDPETLPEPQTARTRPTTPKQAPAPSTTVPAPPTGTRATGRGDRPYRCGHCAVHNHHACIRQVPCGSNTEKPPTPCTCYQQKPQDHQ